MPLRLSREILSHFLSSLVAASRVFGSSDTHYRDKACAVQQAATRIVNLVLVFVGAVLPALIVWCLYMPLFSLIGKLETH